MSWDINLWGTSIPFTPGLITGMHRDVTTEVQMGAHKVTTVHTDMLKPCKPKHCPQWLLRAEANLQACINKETRPTTQEPR